MKTAQLTDAILSRMPASARRTMGLQTGEEATAKCLARSERELQNQIAGLLTIRGIWFCRSRMDRPTTQAKGVPDFLLCLLGHAVALEAKYDKGKLSAEQERTHEQMKANGWKVHVVRTLDETRMLLNCYEV